MVDVVRRFVPWTDRRLWAIDRPALLTAAAPAASLPHTRWHTRWPTSLPRSERGRPERPEGAIPREERAGAVVGDSSEAESGARSRANREHSD